MTLLEQFRVFMSTAHYAKSTIKVYMHRVEEYIRWQKDRYGRWVHPTDLTEDDLEKWLNFLAIKKRVSPTTQNQAFSAVLLFYKQIIKRELKGVNALRATTKRRVPVVLSQTEISLIAEQLRGRTLLIMWLLYGCGLRISEVLALRVKDVDFCNELVIVRNSKGDKDRTVRLPPQLIGMLQRQIAEAEMLWQHDERVNGGARVPLPYALTRKYPKAESDFAWYWVFPSHQLSACPETKRIGRFHICGNNLNKVFVVAARKVRIFKKISCHTFRHSFATHHINSGTDLPTLAALLGHSDVKTTMIYVQVAKDGPQGRRSPLELLADTLARRNVSPIHSAPAARTAIRKSVG